MKPTLSRPAEAARRKAEINGRRSAQAAFDHVKAHGYGTADPVFREAGLSLLSRWARERGLPNEVQEVWLTSAFTQFDALIEGRGQRIRDR